MAGNTPFRRWKREVFRGGCTDPFILHWPAGVEQPGELRTQYAHIIDMVPTVLDLLGIEPPKTINGIEQAPIEGVSFAHTINDAEAPTHHTTQYFEMLGTRAIDHDGWRAVCGWPGPSITEGAEKGRHLFDQITPEILEVLDAEEWMLFNIAEDPAEAHDLADEHPEKLRELIDLWWVEAEKYNVLPIDATFHQRAMVERPQANKPRQQFVYYPGLSVVPTFNTPPILNRPHSITAELEIPEGGAEGVILAQAGYTGGFSLYVQDGLLHYVHNYVGQAPLRGRLRPAAAHRPGHGALRVRGHHPARAPRGPRRRRARPALLRRQARRQHRDPASRRRSCSASKGSPAATTPAQRSSPPTRHRSRSPARSARSPSTSPASCSSTTTTAPPTTKHKEPRCSARGCKRTRRTRGASGRAWVRRFRTHARRASGSRARPRSYRDGRSFQRRRARRGQERA